MRLTLSLLLAAVVVSTIACEGRELGVTPTPRAKVEQIDPLISWSSGPKIFPPSWLEAPFYQTSAPIDPSCKERARAIIRRALQKYPAALIARTIANGRIYVLGELKVYRSMQFAGTASHEAIYIVVRDASEGYTDEFIESAFHQEYSTLLMNRYLKRLDMKAWRAVNPKDFAYLGPNSWDRTKGKDGGAQAITKARGGKLMSIDDDRLKEGFLVRYSTSSLENDVNGYAAALFCGGGDFWDNVKKYPAVRKKTDLAIEFYHRLDPAFTQGYFRGLSRREGR